MRLHFPDGNATIARLLVRNLIPNAVPGHSADDVVTARVNYAQLDRGDSAGSARLNSIVIRARHLGDPKSAGPVEVTYLRGGRAFTARARGVVLACYNMMIPYLCPELPAAQKEALHKLVKTPLVYTSVALRNRRAFDALKLSPGVCPRRLSLVFSFEPARRYRRLPQSEVGGRSRFWCTWCARPARRGCPNMIKIGRAGPNY